MNDPIVCVMCATLLGFAIQSHGIWTSTKHKPNLLGMSGFHINVILAWIYLWAQVKSNETTNSNPLGLRWSAC